ALVVEDHEPTARLLADWLSGVGLATRVASDGAEGLELARQLRPRLVGLGLNLPRLDGWQGLRARKADAGTAGVPGGGGRVVAGGGEGVGTGAVGAPLGWAREFFVKPVEREVFLGRLGELLPDLFQPGRGPRVLLVDDDPVARKLLGDLLRGEGALVTEA